MQSPLVHPGQQLVLLGSGTSIRFAPFDDETCVFWGPAELAGKVPRLDVAATLYPEKKLRAEGLWAPLRDLSIPVYMQLRHSDVPASRIYPLEAVTAAFTVQGCAKPFLTSTVAYLLALALIQEPAPASIRIFGVDLTQGTEYESQRTACAFFAGVCVGRGIPLYVHPVSSMLHTQYLYGYEEDARAAQLRSLRERELYFRVHRDRAIGDIQAAVTRLVHTNAVLGDMQHHVERAEQ